nr:MAG TPA: hypothetical protein [Caudoviricetes sp.]
MPLNIYMCKFFTNYFFYSLNKKSHFLLQVSKVLPIFVLLRR